MEKKYVHLLPRKKTLFAVIEPYLYLFPAFLLLITLTYHPFGTTIVKSLFLTNYLGQIREFIGFENYQYLLKDPVFIKSIFNTMKFTLIVVPLSVGVSFVFAMLCNKKHSLSPVYESFFSLPMAMSASVACMIFEVMFNPSLGIVNRILHSNISWLNNQATAIWVLIIIRVWMNIGYNFLFLLAAIRALPREVIESAEVEGGNIIQVATKIILPMISPTVFFLACNSLAKTMTMSGLSLILTPEGGPNRTTETMISFMYKSVAQSQNYNVGYPAAFFAFCVTLLAVVLTFTFERKGVHYE